MAIETLGAAMRQVGLLFGGGTVTGLSDGQLLERFLADRDASAFEALVARHGPMVLSACRGVLRDPADAEDAYQATFLILVKKARSIRTGQSLGGWLYQVAHRVAIQANVVAARRRAREREAGQMTAASARSGSGAPDDLLPALHDEIARLPEKYRLPVVLCDLEGLPQADAAGQLNWSERTLRRRLAEARGRLKGRLARRGLAPEGAALSAVFLGQARAAVPPAWDAAVVRAAIHSIDPVAATGTASAAAQSLSQEVLKAMFVQKLTIAAAALLGAGLVAWAAGARAVQRDDKNPGPSSAAVARRPGAEADPLDMTGTFTVRGRVLDPGGKPVTGADVYVRHEIDLQLDQGRTPSRRRSVPAAVSDADGLFRFELDKAASDAPFSNGPPWHGAQVAAVAHGFGPDWVTVESLLPGREAVLRLVPDDVPIRGRIFNAEGRPAAGVTVRVDRVATPRAGADLDEMLASGRVDGDVVGGNWFHQPTWLGHEGTWTTDADGRFEIAGIGRDRVVSIELAGPGLECGTFCAMARPAQGPIRTRPPSDPRRTVLRFPAPRLVAATFDHVLGPSRPITGIVRSKGTGKPLPGIRVKGTASPTGPRISALTDARGRFRLDGLPKAGSYEVGAEPRSGIDPFLGVELTITDTAGLGPIETALELPRGVIVTGRLIDPATGRAVPTYELTYHRMPGNRNEGRSDTGRSGATDPTFRITVPPGEGILTTDARGPETPYARARLRPADRAKFPGGDQEFDRYYSRYHAYRLVEVPAGVDSVAIDLELSRGEARKGKVIDPDGRPVVGARCYGLRPTWGYIKTLDDDTFEVLGLEPGRPRLLIFAHQGRRLVGSLVVGEKELASSDPLVVRLRPAGSIEGRLVDGDGLPLAGARIGVMTYDLEGVNLPPGHNHFGSYCLWPDGEIAITDAAGRFRIDGLKPGVKSSIDIDNPVNPSLRLYLDKLLGNVDIRPGEVRDVGDIKVKAVRQ